MWPDFFLYNILNKHISITQLCVSYIDDEMSLNGSIWIINSQIDGLEVAVQELANTFTGSEPIWVPCVGLHENYGICTQVEHERTTLSNSQRCKKHQNAATVLRKFTSSLVTWVRKCIQADGGHFEKLAWVVNRESVTLHLTTYLNKCTKFLFPF